MTRLVSSNAPDALDQAAAALVRGEVIAIPTETVYGLAVLPTENGLRRLIAVKRRSAEKGVQVLIDSIDQARSVAVLGDPATRLARAFWPGALTIVLRRREDVVLPEALGGGRLTLGLRLPDHVVPRTLAGRLGPIAASSANVSGEPDATTAQSVDEALGDEVFLIVDDGPVRGGTPSTVVDCSDDTVAPLILREGAIARDRIAAALL